MSGWALPYALRHPKLTRLVYSFFFNGLAVLLNW